MLITRKIRVGRKIIEGLATNLQSKNFILLKGSRGYIMCGYLNLKTAEKFKDAAVKIVGVATLEDALKASVAACTSAARRLGIFPGQPVKKVLKIIA